MEDLLSVAKPLIELAEGLRLRAYKDTKGNLTIGYGHNLDAKGISKNIASLILDEDLHETVTECQQKIDFFHNLSIPYQYVLVNLCFNMGIGGLLSFERMLAAMKNGDGETAAKELSHSLENQEVPNRVFPLIKILETGKMEN